MFLYSERFTNNSDTDVIRITMNLTECYFPTSVDIACMDYLKEMVGLTKKSICNSNKTVLNITDDKFKGSGINNTLLSFYTPIQCLPSYNRNISVIVAALSGDYIMLKSDGLFIRNGGMHYVVGSILALLIALI
jgi:hypothetical protein